MNRVWFDNGATVEINQQSTNARPSAEELRYRVRLSICYNNYNHKFSFFISDFVHIDNDDDVQHQADEMRRLDLQVGKFVIIFLVHTQNN